ncbi:hypothetical protein [Streptomyces scopuliridis]|uniref:hypothetical protein n=1 Tax=Streptomyces scopuliridis TaxID=452529 RepID=UPI0036AE17B5
MKKLPWRDIGLDHYDKATSHHRIEIRRLKAAAFRHLEYPGALQAPQVVRWRKDLTSKKVSIPRLYFATSLPAGSFRSRVGGMDSRPLEDRDPAPPRPRHHLQRGRLENPQWQPPRAMATLRNLAISVFRQDDHTNIAAACRLPPAATPPATHNGP